MYNNYIFDLYGTLIDINTDEWNDDLWKKIAIFYAYKGAHYTYDELNEEYDRLVQAEKKAVLKKSPDTKVVDIKIEKVFRKLFTQKGIKVTKAEVLFIADADIFQSFCLRSPAEVSSHCLDFLLTSHVQTVYQKTAVHVLVHILRQARNVSCPVSAFHHQL